VEIQPHKIFAGESTDRRDNVAGGTGAILEFEDGLRSVFERYRDLQPIHERYLVARVRPNGSGVRKQRLTAHILRVPLKQPEAVTLQRVCKADDLLVAPLGSGFADPKEKRAVCPTQYRAGQRDAWTLDLRPRPIVDRPDRRIQRSLFQRVPKKDVVYRYRNAAFGTCK
jgi:hypothetical protein